MSLRARAGCWWWMARARGALLALALLGAGTAAGELPGLVPTAEQSATAAQILKRLERSHYTRAPLDDARAAAILAAWLDDLDPARLFLLAADVAEFAPLASTLDDQLEAGDLAPAFALFARSRERRIARLDELLADLEAQLAAARFDGEDKLALDRSDAPWPADEAQARALWLDRFRSDVLSLRLAGRDEAAIAETLRRRYEGQRRNLERLEGRDVFRSLMGAVAGSWDPHSEYFPPHDAENFDIQMSLSLEGIGALLGSEGEYTRIERIVPAGPAEKDGRLQPADRIVAVGQGSDGELVDVVGWRSDEVVGLIRGAKGTTVRLAVLPAGQGDAATPTVVDLVRDTVRLEEQAATQHVAEIVRDGRAQRIGVIALPTFYADFDAARRGEADFKSATRDVARLVTELAAEGVAGLVVDLRGNGGGALSEAQELTGLFLGGGPVVQIRGADGRVEVAGVPPAKPLWDGPLAVLVDRLSASASEIFAAAVQDTGRGVVVGSRTFGKGTVQALVPIDAGQLKLTQAVFYRLAGGSTQHEGVLPDVLLPALFDEDLIGESALPAALPWESIPPAPHKQNQAVAELAPALQQRHEERRASDPEILALVEQLALQEEWERRGLRDVVSLNEAARRAQDADMEAALLAIENRRREALGLTPITDIDERERRDPDELDPFAREAAELLLDFSELRETWRLSRRAQVR